MKEKGIYAKYCIANMQHEKDGKGTLRISLILSKDASVLDDFMNIYDECINKSIHIKDVEKGEWKNIDELLADRL